MDSYAMDGTLAAALAAEHQSRQRNAALKAEIEVLRSVSTLEAENAELEKELEPLRKSAKLQLKSRPQPTFRFLDLPREMRDAIYTLCVVVGKVNLPRMRATYNGDMRYEEWDFSSDAQVQLFLVSKQIRDEALEPYLAHNNFYIPAAAQTFVDDDEEASMSLPDFLPGSGYLYGKGTLARDYLRSLSIALDYRERRVDPDGPHGVWEDAGYMEHIHEDDDDDDENALAIELGEQCRRHHHATQDTCTTMRDTINDVRRRFPQLRRLQINLENAFCPLLCHRLVRHLFTKHGLMIVKGELLALDFLGTVSKKERICVRGACCSFAMPQITFHGKQEHHEWDEKFEVIDEMTAAEQAGSEEPDDDEESEVIDEMTDAEQEDSEESVGEE